MYEEKWFYMRYCHIIFYTEWARLGHRVTGKGQTGKRRPDRGGFFPGVISGFSIWCCALDALGPAWPGEAA